VNTAVMTAALRASEQERADRLFDDPLAAAFVAAAGVAEVPLPPGASEFAAVRTRFFDDAARAAARAGIWQVVLLAAGLDARAFRLDWPPGVRLYELDLPETFAVKEPVLAARSAIARCARIVVPADLGGRWGRPLRAAGYDAGAATVWLAEGLLPYFDGPATDRLLAAVTARSAPGSRFAFDYLEHAAADQPAVRATAEAIRRSGAELSTMDSPVERLSGTGWQVEVSRVPALAQRYGRPLPPGTDLAASNTAALVSAAR
jgi:methyltransferase (TIGR00027 family)